MGRPPCCGDDEALKKGPWTPEEDQILIDYIQKHGLGSWRALPKHAGLNRCGKSCRLRWTNYLRPDIKRGKFSEEEERLIIHLHSKLGNKWSAMAARLSGRTDNEIKNYWNTHLKKKLLRAGIDPVTHRTRADLALLANVLGTPNLGNLEGPSTWDGGPLRAQADAAQLARFQLLQTVARAIIAGAPSSSDLVSLVASMLLRSAASVESLFQPSQLFQGLLDGTIAAVVQGFAPEAWGLYNLAAVPNGFDVLGQPCDALGKGELLSATHMSSPEVSTVDNCCGVDYQVPSSSSTPTAASTPSMASASPVHVTMDHPDQEMMSNGDVSDNSLTAASKPWRDLSDVDSDCLWKYFLDDTALQSWSIMP